VARVLFVQADSGGGVSPALAIASRLRSDGHNVRFIGARCLASSIATAGFGFAAFDRTPDFGLERRETDRLRDWSARTSIGAAGATVRLMTESAAGQLADVLEEAHAYRPDVIVCDMMLPGALAAAEVAGVGAVALVHTVAILALDGQPPMPGGLRPASGPLGRLRDAVLAQGRVTFEQRWIRPLREARSSYGLPPVRTLRGQWLRADRVLILSSPAFDLPTLSLPANVRYVGPPLWRAQAQDRVAPHVRKPVVLASLSTTYQRAERYLETLVKALGLVGVDAVVTTGAGYEPSKLGPPPNVDVCVHAPHDALLADARVMVTHAGHGSVMLALAHGVPLVCVPFGRDQPDVALRVERAGAGVTLSRRLLSARRLASAIGTVLEDGSYRRAAQEIGARLGADDAPAAAAREILEVASGRCPPGTPPFAV
jgi:MGT family glycosyltransferase